MACHGLAQAAEEPSGTEPDLRVRVEITGSRIARIDAETALPVQVITREEILRGNWNTASELLQNLPANINGTNPQSFVGVNNPGFEGANLRGLGDGNTLVLLNGRRISNYAFLSGSANLGSIPLAAVDRVEILKDGASSIYGTDAIAGVINFITRTEYAGFDAVAQAGITERGGGDHYQATVSAGWGSLARDRVNAWIAVDWQKDTALAAIDRPFSATSYRPGEGLNGIVNTSFPANIRLNSTHLLNPGYPSGCLPPLAIPLTELNGASGEICGFDFLATANIVPDVDRLTVLTRGTWQVSPDLQVFAEYLYARTQSTIAFSPTPVRLDVQGNPAIYPADGPYYPTDYAAEHGLSGPLRVLYRTVPLGPRTDVVTTNAQRFVVGAQGALAGWEYALGYNYSQNQADDNYTGGWVYASKIIPAIRTGLINPWGPSGQAGQDLLASTEFTGHVRNAKGTMSQVDFHASRDTMELPAGPLSIAVGAEWRRESLVDNPAPVLDTGDIIGAGGQISPQSASRTVGAVFAELNVPLVKNLDLLASVRYDNYSDFGGTTNPKIGFRWQPDKSFLVRGAWGTGFRAPTLYNLYTPQNTVVSEGYEDPIRCPVTKSPDDCEATVNLASGGNPDLQPETSRQWTAGVVWEPAPGWSFGAQWWKIDKSNVIGTLDAGFVLDNYALYGQSNVIRGPTDPAYPNLPGPIDTIIGWNQNLGSVKTAGVDFALRAQMTSPAGKLSFSFDGTYIYQFLEHLPGDDTYSDVGQISPYGAIPRWRHFASLSWQMGPWSATVSQTFQSGLTEYLPPEYIATRRIDSYSLWNLQGVYSAPHDMTIALGVKNLFNTEPPLVVNSRFGFDTSSAQTLGRTFYGRVSISFR